MKMKDVKMNPLGPSKSNQQVGLRFREVFQVSHLKVLPEVPEK